MIEFGARINPKDLARFKNNLPIYAKAVMAKSVDALQKTGELYCLIVISKMGQSAGGEMVFPDTYWKPLSEKWLAEKQARGLVEEVWEATGETKGYIKVHSVKKETHGWSIFAGLKDVPITVLAKALENEFGSDILAGNGGATMYIVPARPLFEPAKREMLHSPFRRQMLLNNFVRAVRSAYGIYRHVKQ